MRILFLVHRLPYPPDKGDKIRSFWELKTLGMRHRVDVFCFYDDPRDRNQIQNLLRYCHSCYAEPLSFLRSRAQSILATARGESFTRAFYWSPSMAENVAKAVESRNYDLIFVFGSAMAQYAEPWQNIPRILDLVDVDSEKWTQYGQYKQGWARRLWVQEGQRLRALEATLGPAFHTTLVCTEAEGRLLRSHLGLARITVLENWLNLEFFDPDRVALLDEIKALQPYVLFSGTMDYFPNVDAVMLFAREVFPAIRARVPDIRFVIAGRNPTAEVLGLSKQAGVYVTGAVSDMRPYLRGATVAVAPMRIARGVQNKVLEALAMNLPVIASEPVARALPKFIASLLMLAPETSHYVEHVQNCLRAQNRGDLRRNMKRYFADLDVAGQLESLIHSAVGESEYGRKEIEALTASALR